MPVGQSLDPRVKTAWRIAATLGLAPVVAGVLIAGLVVRAWWLWGVVVVVVVLAGISAFWLPAIQYRHWAYSLRPHDLILRSGVIVRVERLLPRTRIQHVDIVEGALDRWLGIAKLRVFTAGSSNADVTVPGVAAEDAVGLRDELLAWVTSQPSLSEAPQGSTPAVASPSADLTRDDVGIVTPDETEHTDRG